MADPRRDPDAAEQPVDRFAEFRVVVDDVELLLGNRKATPLGEIYEYEPGWGALSDEDAAAIIEIMSQTAPTEDDEDLPVTSPHA